MAAIKTAVPPLHDIDIRLLRLFKAVAESEGFAAAEETVGVGRSTISKHIADLESRLGVRLCDRGRSGFQMTPHGRVVYDATLELLDALDGFRSQVSTAKSKIFGTVTLWVMDNTLHEIGNPVGLALRRFQMRPGKIQLHINAASPLAVEEAVATRRANVGVTIVNSEIPGLTYRVIGAETTALYCGVDHPLAIAQPTGDVTEADLEGVDFVTRGYLRSDPTLHGRPRVSTAVAHHVEGAVQLLLSGHHVGVLPDHIARPWVISGKMLKLKVAVARTSTPLCVVFRTKSHEIPAIAALIEDLAQGYGVC
jgi:DNA-binding transcriptional LysR family regulator